MKAPFGGKETVTARDIMVSRLHTTQPDQRVFTVVKSMLKHKISGLPVVDSDYTLVGVISEKDCLEALMRAIHHGLPASTVGEVMTKELITVEESTPFLTIAHIFSTKRIRRLPVVRGSKLVGQISRRDALAAATHVFENAPNRSAAVLYLSAIHEANSSPPIS